MKFSLLEKAKKELDSLEPGLKNRILKELIILRDYGFSSKLDIKKLKGYKNHYRLRIGKYRILFELEKPRRIIMQRRSRRFLLDTNVFIVAL